jgi:hypothetical protein
MFRIITRTTLSTAAALAGAAAITAPAHAASVICIPDTAGAAVTSGGPLGACNNGTAVKMPATAADQQKLIDLLPYITYKAAGIGQKPTLKFTGLNVQISKKEYPGYGNTDGTGNLIIGDSGDNYYAATSDYRYSGSENLIMGSSNQWRARASLIVGENNRVDSTLSIVHGQNNNIAGFQAFVTGNSRTLGATETYKVIADGAGKDVKWVRYDATGKVVASSEPQTGDAYFYGSTYYSLTKFDGVSAANCALSAQVEGPDGQVTSSVVTPYYGYIYARFTKPTPSGTTSALSVPHTVIAVCNKGR